MFYKIALLILLCGSSNSSSAQEANGKPFTIPALQYWKGATGNFIVNPKRCRLVIELGANDTLKNFVQTFLTDINAIYPKNKVAIFMGKPAKGDFYFSLNTNDTLLGNEGYKLEISDFVTIKAHTAKAAFWATRSVLQILEQSKRISLPKGMATDYPKYPVRGFVLDVGRKFFSLQFLRDYVKFMAYYKMNDFHIHLNDNGFKEFFNGNWDETYSAFRLQNDTYPGLTAKDGSYTKQEFKDLQKLAIGYGVNIIPEIDVPAHSLAFVKLLPAIGSAKYGKDHLDITNPTTFEVIDNVFKEYLQGPEPVFMGKEVHIGTDEYAKAEAENFRAFTNHYIKLVQGYGKKARLWGALTHATGTTPVSVKDVTMNIWYNGYANPKDMMDLGYDIISSPDGWLYIVPAAGYYFDYLDIKNIYANWAPNVIGDQTFPENLQQIKGGSFAVWNDHVGNGITEKDVHDRVFTAMQVIAQKTWGGSTIPFPLETYIAKSAFIGEGPGLNMAGKVIGKDSLVLHYELNKHSIADISANKRKGTIAYEAVLEKRQAKKAYFFNGTDSYIKTPLNGIGYGYTVSFCINPDTGNKPDAILFSSPDATVKLNQQATGKLGFSRENYNYHFNYTVPANKWTTITITGNSNETCLYVNGVLNEKLEPTVLEFPNTKNKIVKVQTLFFPLQFVGSNKNSFKGYLSNLKVFNKMLTAEEIAKQAN
jgi:hexosaminidase